MDKQKHWYQVIWTYGPGHQSEKVWIAYGTEEEVREMASEAQLDEWSRPRLIKLLAPPGIFCEAEARNYERAAEHARVMADFFRKLRAQPATAVPGGFGLWDYDELPEVVKLRHEKERQEREDARWAAEEQKARKRSSSK